MVTCSNPVAPAPAQPCTCIPLPWEPPASYGQQLLVLKVESRELRRFPGMGLETYSWEVSLYKKMKKGTGLRCLLAGEDTAAADVDLDCLRAWILAGQ